MFLKSNEYLEMETCVWVNDASSQNICLPLLSVIKSTQIVIFFSSECRKDQLQVFVCVGVCIFVHKKQTIRLMNLMKHYSLLWRMCLAVVNLSSGEKRTGVDIVLC